MDHTVLVCEREPIGSLRKDVDDLFGREHDARVENLAQRLTAQELHGDVGNRVALAHVVDRDDVEVVETPRRPGFAIEAPFEDFGILARHVEIHGLERYDTVEQGVSRLVHDAHRPVTQFPEDLVAA